MPKGSKRRNSSLERLPLQTARCVLGASNFVIDRLLRKSSVANHRDDARDRGSGIIIMMMISYE